MVVAVDPCVALQAEACVVAAARCVRRFCRYHEERGECRFLGRRLLRNRGEFSCTHLNALAKLEFIRIGTVANQFDLHF